jgi:type III secretory pathway lipoprotein EscJ
MLLAFVLLTMAATACLVCVLLDLLAQRGNEMAALDRRAGIRLQRRQAERQIQRTTVAALDAMLAEAFGDRREDRRR